MRASSPRLASAVALRLSRFAPTRFEIQAQGDRVEILLDGALIGTTRAAAIVEDDDDRTIEEKLATALLAVLDGVQDSISRELRKPWPYVNHNKMALPGVRIEDGTAWAWYGENEVVAVVALRPIDLGEFTDT